MSERIRQEIAEEDKSYQQSEDADTAHLSSAEREAVATSLDNALNRFGSFILSSEEDLAGASPEQKEEVGVIRNNAGKALKALFKTFKISVGVGTLALVIGGTEGFDSVLDAYAGRKSASPATDILHKHPTMSKIAEWYFGQNLMEVIDTYQKLAASRVNGHMTPEEIVYRERISNNVFPGTQGEAGQSSSWKTTELGRLKMQFENFSKDTGRVSKKNLEVLPENSTYEKYVKMGTEVRSDMFRLYLGLAPHFNLVEDSAYKPTKAKHPDTKYKSFSAKKILDSIRLVGKDMKAREELAEENEKAYAALSFEALWSYTKEFRALPQNAYTQALGTYMVDQGYDSEKGERYISYYDIWDLDIKPFRLAGMDMDKYNFPFEVYGRIYESDLK